MECNNKFRFLALRNIIWALRIIKERSPKYNRINTEEAVIIKKIINEVVPIKNYSDYI